MAKFLTVEKNLSVLTVWADYDPGHGCVTTTHLVEAELQHLLSGQPRVLAEQELLPLALNLEGCGHRDSGAETLLEAAVRVK
jgi:hypothetical protein